jgi:hypothetical protein
MFEMHRVYCATPWEMEREQKVFYEEIGKFNETALMPMGVLFVPVSLPNIEDKRPHQYTVDENIRECRHSLFVLSEDWGPTARNFRHDYELAMECLADPALPMQDVAVLIKAPVTGLSVAPELPEPRGTFSNVSEFRERLASVLSGWMETLPPTREQCN